MEPENLTTQWVFEDSRDSYHGKKLKAWKSCINIPYLKINTWGSIFIVSPQSYLFRFKHSDCVTWKNGQKLQGGGFYVHRRKRILTNSRCLKMNWVDSKSIKADPTGDPTQRSRTSRPVSVCIVCTGLPAIVVPFRSWLLAWKNIENGFCK